MLASMDTEHDGSAASGCNLDRRPTAHSNAWISLQWLCWQTVQLLCRCARIAAGSGRRGPRYRKATGYAKEVSDQEAAKEWPAVHGVRWQTVQGRTRDDWPVRSRGKLVNEQLSRVTRACSKIVQELSLAKRWT